jgi:hypothetical protein
MVPKQVLCVVGLVSTTHVPGGSGDKFHLSEVRRPDEGRQRVHRQRLWWDILKMEDDMGLVYSCLACNTADSKDCIQGLR